MFLFLFSIVVGLWFLFFGYLSLFLLYLFLLLLFFFLLILLLSLLILILLLLFSDLLQFFTFLYLFLFLLLLLLILRLQYFLPFFISPVIIPKIFHISFLSLNPMQPISQIILCEFDCMANMFLIRFFKQKLFLCWVCFNSHRDVRWDYHIAPIPPHETACLLLLLPSRHIRSQCPIRLGIPTKPLLKSQPSQPPFPIMVKMQNRRIFQQQHIIIPVD